MPGRHNGSRLVREGASSVAADFADIPAIERELDREGIRIAFRDIGLEQRYQAEQANHARQYNRITLVLLIAVFDAFFIPEIHAIPEAVLASAILRFGLLTPAAILFVLLDWRGMTGRWTPALLTALLTAPNVIAGFLNMSVTSATALPNFQAVPLLQLAVLTCRVSVRQAAIINSLSCAIYVTEALTLRFVPDTGRPSLVLTALAIGIATTVFAWRLEVRDRRVFLFTLQATIGREMLAAQNRMLERMTQIDALTGLGNRRCFDDVMTALWQAASDAPMHVTLVMFDIDCFKQFNDALGHQAGDECLGAVARAVARCVRDERDTLVRYGGEEFAIILPHASLEEGGDVAEQVRLAVLARGLPHPGGGAHHLVTVSLGVSMVTAPVKTIAFLIEEADQRLYEAKRRGRNCVVVGPEAADTRAARLA